MIQFPIIGKSLVRKFLMSIFPKNKSIIIANSKFTSTYIQKSYHIKPIIINPPIYFKRNKININEILKEKENIILSVGRFTNKGHNKKQDALIKAFKKMNDQNSNLRKWKLILVGAVKKEDLDYLSLLKKKARGYNIEIYENIDINDIIKFFKISKIYWHATGYGTNEMKYPEKMEHFGMTTIEAMNFGCVPIVINKGGQKEIIVDNKNGFLWNTMDELINYTLRTINHSEDLAIKAYKESYRYNIKSFDAKLKILFES